MPFSSLLTYEKHMFYCYFVLGFLSDVIKSYGGKNKNAFGVYDNNENLETQH